MNRAETAAAALAIRACMGHSGGDTSDGERPSEDWRSDWDADRAADKWENETRRWWP